MRIPELWVRKMTGAVILAAGPGRMSDFQPLLEVAGTTAIKRQISTLRQAGVERFVVVTGYRAEDLERHLAHRGVAFIRNENYRDSQMLDSIKLGLSEACGWDRALILPADLPSFQVDTIRRILARQEEIVIPRYQGQNGHPIALASTVFERIQNFQGEDGLRGIFRSSNPSYVEVEDAAILLRANTDDRYQEILDYEEKSLMEIPLRVELQATVCRKEPFFDETLAQFLELVEERGSMLAAGQELKMAYSRCWKMVGAAEGQLGFPLVERQAGGSRGGSTHLTEQGKNFIRAYREFHEKLETAAEEIYKTTMGEMFH